MKEVHKKRLGRESQVEFSCPAEKLAPWLLGKILCRQINGEQIEFRITETEAYPCTDSACYGYNEFGQSKQTEVTAPLFQSGGTCCVYAGMLLISCGGKGTSENVLIRCTGTLNGGAYFDGPMKVFKALNIEKTAIHGKSILELDDLWIETDGAKRECCQAQRLRLGRSVKKEDEQKPLRFIAV